MPTSEWDIAGVSDAPVKNSASGSGKGGGGDWDIQTVQDPAAVEARQNVLDMANRAFDEITAKDQAEYHTSQTPVHPYGGAPVVGVNADQAARKVPILGSIVAAPQLGTEQIGQGLGQMGNGDVARGAGNVLVGATKVATPAMLAGFVYAPIEAAGWTALSLALGAGGKYLAKQQGASEEDAAEVGEVAGALPLIYGFGRMGLKGLAAQRAQTNAEIGKYWQDLGDRLAPAREMAGPAGDPIPVTLSGPNGKVQAQVELAGLMGEGANAGRPVMRVVRTSDGQNLFTGTAGSVTEWLGQRAADPTWFQKWSQTYSNTALADESAPIPADASAKSELLNQDNILQSKGRDDQMAQYAEREAEATKFAQEAVANGEKVSTAQIQRKFKLGYGRASRVVQSVQATPVSNETKPDETVSNQTKPDETVSNDTGAPAPIETKTPGHYEQPGALSGTPAPSPQAAEPGAPPVEYPGLLEAQGAPDAPPAVAPSSPDSESVRVSRTTGEDEAKVAQVVPVEWDKREQKAKTDKGWEVTHTEPASDSSVAQNPGTLGDEPSPSSTTKPKPHEMTFREWRKDERATQVPAGHILAQDPDSEGYWNTLAGSSKNVIQAVAQVMGAPVSGTKDKLIERMRDAWDLRKTLAEATPESLQQMTGAQLKTLADRAGSFQGNKLQTASGLIGWRNRARSEGQKTLALWNWNVAIEKAKEQGLEIPEHVLTDHEQQNKSKFQIEQEIAEQIRQMAGKGLSSPQESQPVEESHNAEKPSEAPEPTQPQKGKGVDSFFPPKKAEPEAPAPNPVVAALDSIREAVDKLQEQITGAPATPDSDNTSSEQPETIEANAEPQPLRGDGETPLEGQLPEASSGTGTGGATRSGSGKRSGTRKPRGRASAGAGEKLDPGAGTRSAGVGSTPEQLEESVTDNLPPRAENLSEGRFEHDYRIPDGRVVTGSPETRARHNIEAIKTLHTLQAGTRAATVAEKEILARYVGWGAVPQLFAGASAEWQALQDELKSLISEDEYTSARKSTTNAHYTGDEQIDAMWQAVLHLGAKPGMSWLEPAIGVGSFFGRQPAELLAGARRVGMDKDELTSQIAKYLYPDSHVSTKAFEESELPHDYFDGAISNVPFGDFGVHDPQWRSKGYLTNPIHNYFFAKSLQLVRPGGVVAFITSRHTMDNEGASALAFRAYIAEHADLLGAVRLPSNAFMQSSGTHVITDLIFLRRRLPGAEPAGEAWQKVANKQLPARVDETTTYKPKYPEAVNEYYHAHPDHVLGTEELNRGQFSSHDYKVVGKITGPELAEKLKQVLPADAFQKFTPERKPQRRTLSEIKSDTAEASKLGAFFFDEKGNLFRKTSKGSAEPFEASAGTRARIKGQLQIRNILLQLVDAEVADQPEAILNDLRKALNRVYDKYVKEYGPLSSRANQAAVKGDPDAPWLITLERNFDGKTASKAPLFERRMLPADLPATRADSAKDALYVSLNETGTIDWQRMADLTNKKVEDLQRELSDEGIVFQDPRTKTWQTEDEYLSGAVRSKLKEAQKIAALEPQFERNAKALEAVQPDDIPPSEISAALGVTWVPGEIYSAFAQEALNTRTPLRVAHVGNEWIIEGDSAQKTKWDTNRVNGRRILEDTLNVRRTKVYDKEIDGSVHLNKEETLAAQNKQLELLKEFEQWLFRDGDRGVQMARLYNDLNNDIRQRTFNGAHLTLPGMTRDLAVLRSGKLDPHQLSAVWQQIVQANVLLAHAPGAGKTFEMIAAAMELKRLGLVRRPMFVVPNSTLTGWQIQFTALYPKARVLVFSETDLDASKRKAVMAQIATGDYDAVVVPHSSFGLLPTGDEIFEEHFAKLEADLVKSIKDAQEAQLDTRMIKRMEKAKERLLTNLRNRRNASRKDNTVTWEQLGIDQLFVDEAHEYKKLGFTTKQNGIAGIDSDGNQKTFDLLMKVRYTQKFGRGVVFATGTPVTNTMGELFTLMRYLIEPEMEGRGLGQFDDWAAQFGRTVPVFEPKIGAGYQLKNRFAEFVNLPELSQLFRSFANVITGDMLDIPRPALKGGERKAIITELNAEQQEYTKELISRAEDIKRDPQGAKPDNMLAVYIDAQKMSLDMRMVNPFAEDDPEGRLSKAADNIAEIFHRTADKRLTQLVFADLGKPESEKGKRPKPKPGKMPKPINNFSAYDALIAKLVARGIPRDEIAHIYVAKNKIQRTKLFHEVNEGKIRVLIGSTQKMGIGVNVQQKVIAMHHLDVPHRPDQLEQREARGWRQGNENPEVSIFYYVTRRSLDENKFGNVLRKARFIASLLQGKVGVRRAEDIEGMVPTLEMMQAAASGDPRVLEKVQADADVDRYSSLRRAFNDKKFNDRRQLAAYQDSLRSSAGTIAKFDDAIKLRDKTGRVWQIGKHKFEGEGIRDKVAAALDKIDLKSLPTDSYSKIGSVFGFPLSASHGRVARFEEVKGKTELVYKSVLQLRLDLGPHSPSLESDAGGAGLVAQVENAVRNLEQERDRQIKWQEDTRRDIATLEQQLTEKWPYEAEYEKALARQDELIKALGGGKPDQSLAAFDDGEQIEDESVEGEEEQPESEDEDEAAAPDAEETALERRRRTEGGVLIIPADKVRKFQQLFRGTADGEPMRDYSFMGATKSMTIRNLSQLEEASPSAHSAVVRAASWKAQAATLLRAAWPKVVKALGTDTTDAEFRLGLIQSRLYGTRDRWNDLGQATLQQPDDKLLDWVLGGPLQLLAAMSEEGDLAQQAAALAANIEVLPKAKLHRKAHENLRRLVSESFFEAADAVKEMMTEDEFNTLIARPGFQRALDVYHSEIEPELAESHQMNEGVFSDALGPLDAYYPLVPIRADDQARAITGARRGFRKPANISNGFTTGLADDYDATMEAFADKVSAALRVNDKAAAIQALMDAGIVQKLKPGQSAETVTFGGKEYAAKVEETGPARTIVQDGKTIHIAPQRVAVPEPFWHELKPVLFQEAKLPPNVVTRLLHAFAMLTLSGPADMVFHSHNLLGALVGNTPWLGESLAEKTIGNTPLTKVATAVIKLVTVDPMDDAAVKDLQQMAKLGLLPERFGRETFSKEYALMTGAKVKRWYLGQFGPALYGPKGIDVRARLVMYRIAREMSPDATDLQLYKFVNQLGNYTESLQGHLERSLKSTGLSPFYTAGSTMMRNGIDTWLGTGSGSGPTGGAGRRVAQMLSAGAIGLIALWILASYAMTGLYPWEDKRSKFLKIRVSDQMRRSPLGVAIWGKDVRKDGELNIGFASPLVGRGARAIGAQGAIDTALAGGNTRQMIEGAKRDIANTAIHPIAGPAVRAGLMAATGKEAYLVNDRQGGSTLMSGLPKGAPIGSELKYAARELNSFYGNVGASLGFEGPHDAGGTFWDHILRAVVEMTGLTAQAANPWTTRKALADQRRAHR